jgi:6-pyruvoyl-tetrahydropterin synthase
VIPVEVTLAEQTDETTIVIIMEVVKVLEEEMTGEVEITTIIEAEAEPTTIVITTVEAEDQMIIEVEETEEEVMTITEIEDKFNYQ